MKSDLQRKLIGLFIKNDLKLILYWTYIYYNNFKSKKEQ